MRPICSLFVFCFKLLEFRIKISPKVYRCFFEFPDPENNFNNSEVGFADAPGLRREANPVAVFSECVLVLMRRDLSRREAEK